MEREKMRSILKAIFFDIGGTLRVTYKDEVRDQQKIRELINFLGEKCTPEEMISRIRRGEKSYRRWCKPNFIELSEQDLWTRFILPDYPPSFIREHAVKLNQMWRDSRPKHILPDMVETMQTLNQRGYKLGIISNTTSSIEGYQMLASAGLTDLFSCVILSAEFGRRKPHPSLFIEAARKAGVQPQECVYVGDRPSRDLVGARQSNYGEVVIINTEGYTTDENDPDDYDPEKDSGLMMHPDHFIGRLTQLLDYYPTVSPSMADSHSEPGSVVLYDAALSTMWGVDQPLPLNQTFEATRSIGISRFELNHKFTPELFAQFDSDRYYVSTLHDPCPAPLSLDELKRQDLLISSPDEDRRKAAVDGVKRTIDLACRLGARSVVIHPGSVLVDSSRDRRLRELFKKGLSGSPDYSTLKEEMVAHRAQNAVPYVDQVCKSLLEIIDHAKGSGIALGLENRYRYYDIPLPGELESFLGLSSENWFGFQFDCGHAQALDQLGLVPMMDWLEKFGKRMVGCHLHDVSGITDHQAPGMGEVDFKRIAPFIPENACRTLEIGPQATLEQLADGLEVLASAGCIGRIG